MKNAILKCVLIQYLSLVFLPPDYRRENVPLSQQQQQQQKTELECGIHTPNCGIGDPGAGYPPFPPSSQVQQDVGEALPSPPFPSSFLSSAEVQAGLRHFEAGA